jgi:hypothetical protein
MVSNLFSCGDCSVLVISGLVEAVPLRVKREFELVAELEFGEDGCKVISHCGFGDLQLFGRSFSV